MLLMIRAKSFVMISTDIPLVLLPVTSILSDSLHHNTQPTSGYLLNYPLNRTVLLPAEPPTASPRSVFLCTLQLLVYPVTQATSSTPCKQSIDSTSPTV
jgi:hypothetical protein